MNFLTQQWEKLSNIGLSKQMDTFLQDRIKLSNRFSLLVMGLAIFLLIKFAKGSNLQVFWILLAFAFILPLLNYFKLNIISRLLLALTPTTVVLLYDISNKINPPGTSEPLTYVSPHFVIVASVCLPLTLFTLREKIPLAVSILYVLVASLGFDEIYRFFGAHFDQYGMNNPRYGFVMVNVIVVMVLLLSTFGFLLYSSNKSEQINQHILLESQQKNEDLNSSEERLKNSLQAIEMIREDDERRAWVSVGLADFSQILRDNAHIQKMYNTLISSLVQYLKAQLGTLYLLQKEDEEEYLQLQAAYACDLEKIQHPKVYLGEGLLGQSLRNRKINVVEDLPENYFRIQSSFLNLTPKCLIIIPLFQENTLMGVIEIASVKKIETFQVEFLEKLAEAISSTLGNLRMNQQTQILLKEAHHRNEIIRNKEDEFIEKEQRYLEKIQALEAKLAELKDLNIS